jgi:DNA-binding transcriptional ArsR family regulator
MIAQQPVNVNTIAEKFDVSRQAISLHLKILSECDLLNIRQIGRERLCEAKLEKLDEVYDWVEQYHKLWTTRLKALKDFVEKEELQSKNEKTTDNKSIRNIGRSKKVENGKSYKKR